MSVKKERKDSKEGIAAKRHKKRKKNYEKIKGSNPRYRDYRPRLAFEFPPGLEDSYLALFCDLCALLRLIPFLAQRRRFLIPPILRLLCLFAAIPRLVLGRLWVKPLG
jgi:hypothetical protein